MRVETQTASDFSTPETEKIKQNLLFSSGTRELRAIGTRERITLPARDGSQPESAFYQAVSAGLNRARQAGQTNPIVMGAIPFDPNEPSCLYVPEAYEWCEHEETDAGFSPDETLGTLISQRSIPDENGFKKSVEHAIVNFSHSDVRKAVLSVMRELKFQDDIDVSRLLARLRSQNKTGYQFRVPMLDGGELIGISPELLVRKQGNHLTSNPLAGSAKRHADAEADAAVAKRLKKSEKDLYEHSLVIEDIERLLKPHCRSLQVPSAPSPICTAALWHLSTKIEAELSDPGMTALQLACMLHPTPAVCGFPTERAHKLIRFVEPFERGLFTGMVGWCDAQGNGEWVVTIRCGTAKANQLNLYAGAGIVAASDPASEWAEVQTKLTTMLNACGLSA